jgi:uncharacterized membrane protein
VVVHVTVGVAAGAVCARAAVCAPAVGVCVGAVVGVCVAVGGKAVAVSVCVGAVVGVCVAVGGKAVAVSVCVGTMVGVSVGPRATTVGVARADERAPRQLKIASPTRQTKPTAIVARAQVGTLRLR